MSKLLINEHPLQVLPSLAVKIGLNEAVILQQIHYWTSANKETRKNYREGHHWTYNSYDEWAKQFPFWSVRTIQRAIKRLEVLGLLITGNYNRLPIDRTKWYRINYRALEALETSPLRQNGTMDTTKCRDGHDRVTPPLPETITETTTDNNDKGQNSRPDYSLEDYAKDIVRKYVCTYKEILGKDHPRLRREQLERVIDVIVGFESDAIWQPVDWSAMIERHFERGMDTDYNINHFATPGVLDNIRYEIGFEG